VNNRIKINNDASKNHELEELFKSNMNEFYNKLIDDREQLFWQPIFDKFDVNKCYNSIIRFSNKTRWQFFNLLDYRYFIYNNDYTEFKHEVNFFQKLHPKIQRKNKLLGGKNPVGFVYSQLDDLIERLIKKLNSIP